jgi:hypothetical protein
MSRQKRVFIGVCVAFLILLLYASYDIANRTTFPGSKPQLKERINTEYFSKDSMISADSLTNMNKVSPLILKK